MKNLSIREISERWGVLPAIYRFFTARARSRCDTVLATLGQYRMTKPSRKMQELRAENI